MTPSFGPGWSSTKVVETEYGDRKGLKVGRVDAHVVHSDEPETAGGQDEYPSPLSWLALSVGWCVLTQIERYSEMLKTEVDDASCTVEMDFNLTGSALRGTIQAGCGGVRTHLRVQSRADVADVVRVVSTARRGCFVEQLIGRAVPIACTLEVNGELVPLDDDVDVTT